MTTVSELQDYRFRGARALILMHEQSMREFLAVWRKAKQADLTLPETEDPDYASLETLLFHLLRSARGYMIWICEKLELPDPQIRSLPALDSIEQEAAGFLTHVLERWRLPLVDQDEQTLSFPSFKSRWEMDYSIESMLEHAVVHPQRHTFQLKELMGE
jgi:uncharacterized damage-inducible protein DinB